jgi:ubiquinone/menaquinone biosynthesis C-methylase UbiE
MREPRSLHDTEWRTGWKSLPTAFDQEDRFSLVSDLILPLSPETIFDLGCGDGSQAEVLKKKIPNVAVAGCDISPTAVERASKRMDACYNLDIDKSDLPEETESYDLVLCIAVLEHLYDVSHALKEINRILIPGKHALIQVPNITFWKFRLQILIGKLPYILADERHLHSFNKSFLLENLQQAGFTNYRIYGQRHRIKWLVKVSPSLFSENFFVVAQKTMNNLTSQES